MSASSRPALDRILGRMADGGSLVLGLLVVAALVPVAIPRSRPVIARMLHQPHSGLAVGDTIAAPREFYEAHRTTAFLFGTSTCSACVSSAPLFASIRGALEKQSSGFVLVNTDDPAALKTHSYINRLGPEHLTIWRGGDQRVRVTPTLVVVDRSGRIQFIQEGEPASAEAATALTRAVLR